MGVDPAGNPQWSVGFDRSYEIIDLFFKRWIKTYISMNSQP